MRTARKRSPGIKRIEENKSGVDMEKNGFVVYNEPVARWL